MPAANLEARRIRASWLRRIRSNRGFTQADIAKRIGVSPNQISRYERGLDDPGLDVLHRLLFALECYLFDLGREIDAPMPPRRLLPADADVNAGAIDVVINEFAMPSRKPEEYPDRMRCWVCHGRPGECRCYTFCKICRLPFLRGRKCSGILHCLLASGLAEHLIRRCLAE